VKQATNHQENAKPHAEMQQIAYGVDKGSTIGVSKPPCGPCENELKKQGMTTNLGHPEGRKNENPKNWVPVPDVEPKFIVKKSPVSVQCGQVQKESVRNHVKSNIGTCYKPKVNGTIAGTIESVVNDIDRSPGASASGPGGAAGTYETRMGTGAYARASVFDAEAHASILQAR